MSTSFANDSKQQEKMEKHRGGRDEENKSGDRARVEGGENENQILILNHQDESQSLGDACTQDEDWGQRWGLETDGCVWEWCGGRKLRPGYEAHNLPKKSQTQGRLGGSASALNHILASPLCRLHFWRCIGNTESSWTRMPIQVGAREHPASCGRVLGQDAGWGGATELSGTTKLLGRCR